MKNTPEFLAELILQTHLQQCSEAKIQAYCDFSNYLVFVSNHKERDRLQNLLIRKILSAGKTTSAIIYPKIVSVVEFYQQPIGCEDSIKKRITTQENSTLQVALKYSKQLKADINILVEHFSALNNLLRYKKKEEVFSSNADALLFLKQFFDEEHFSTFCSQLLDELPNGQNQSILQSLNIDSLEQKYSLIYQLITYGENNLLHTQLQKSLANSTHFKCLHQLKPNITTEELQLHSTKNKFSTYNFTSTNYYEEALSYLINKEQLDSSTLIICDCVQLAKRVNSYLSTHLNIGPECIELQGYLKVSEDIYTQCFLSLAYLIYGDADINNYITLITNIVLEIYDVQNCFQTAKMHGKEFNLESLQEICNLFEHYNQKWYSEELKQFNKILIEASKKQSSRLEGAKSSSFAAKFIALNELFKKLIDENKICTRNLYQLQERAYALQLQRCDSTQFLSILEYLSTNIKYKFQETEECSNGAKKKIIICKSSNLIDIADYSTVYLISLELNAHMSALRSLNLDNSSCYKYNALLKLKAELYCTNKLVLFCNQGNFQDEINFKLLELYGVEEHNLEQQICATLMSEQKEENIEEDYFSKPSDLNISSIYVTALRRLLNDPKEYFVQDILKLRPMESFCMYTYKKHFGNICHEVLNQITHKMQQTNEYANFPQELWEAFNNAVSTEFNEQHYLASIARVEQIAQNLLENINFKAQEVMQEHEISYTINVDGKQIRLKARVDRIEKDTDSFCIIDYKTGTLPPIAAVTNFTDPQLVAEAYIMNKIYECSSNTAVEQNAYEYNVKLIKVNANTKPSVEINVTKIIPEFETEVRNVLKKYLVEEDAMF